jgi:hypothetical protein
MAMRVAGKQRQWQQILQMATAMMVAGDTEGTVNGNVGGRQAAATRAMVTAMAMTTATRLVGDGTMQVQVHVISLSSLSVFLWCSKNTL